MRTNHNTSKRRKNKQTNTEKNTYTPNHKHSEKHPHYFHVIHQDRSLSRNAKAFISNFGCVQSQDVVLPDLLFVFFVVVVPVVLSILIYFRNLVGMGTSHLRQTKRTRSTLVYIVSRWMAKQNLIGTGLLLIFAEQFHIVDN